MVSVRVGGQAGRWRGIENYDVRRGGTNVEHGTSNVER